MEFLYVRFNEIMVSKFFQIVVIIILSTEFFIFSLFLLFILINIYMYTSIRIESSNTHQKYYFRVLFFNVIYLVFIMNESGGQAISITLFSI